MNDDSHEKYKLAPINLKNPSTAHDYLILLTEKNKDVLELGTASGYLTEILKNNNCNVTGLELDSELAKKASQFTNKIIVGDIEILDLKKELSSSKFDVILIGDFLEHLNNPEKILKQLKNNLKPNGYFVISIPNISHGSIRLKLLDGNFDYKKTGLLDATHKKFFTLNTILQLMNNTGLKINKLHRVTVDFFGGSDGPDLKRSIIPSELLQAILRDPESTTFQYVFTANFNTELNKNNWLYQFPKNYTLNDLNNRINALHTQYEHLQKVKEYDAKILNESISSLKQQNTKLKQQNNGLKQQNNGLKQQNTNLQSSIENYQKMITDIHQSFVFRMLHKYDRTIGKIIPLRPKKYTKSTKQQQTIEERETSFKKALNNDLEKKDIICFPIINWDYRYQRPQHILNEFAKKGHRVFYLTVNLRKLEKPYEIKIMADSIYQIDLSSPKFFDIYKDKFNEHFVSNLIDQIKELQKDLKLDAISFVEFPTWGPLTLELRKQLGYPIIFDCLDDFTGFGNVINEREKEELSLISSSDLVLATSSHLMNKVKKTAARSLFLPNAGEFEHFNKIEDGILKYKKPIIGYFGSISDWFDVDLIEYLVRNSPEFTFVMIGHTFGADIRKLQKFPNVHFLGERPYSELPKYLNDFDVCLIPFKMTSLIEATHPVKIYEYFAAGKPVVATNMPELHPMSDMCYLAENKKDFLKKLDLAVNEKDENIVKKRMKFASENTWENRFETLYTELKKIDSFDIEHHS